MLFLPMVQRRLRSQRGFTLIELLIVVAIIAILAAILIPNFLRARAQSQVAATKGNLKNIATALESYSVDNSQYPQTVGALIASYARALPTDPCTGTTFGIAPGFTYVAIGNPATDYVVQTNWSNGGSGSPCWNVNSTNWAYTPGGGLSPTP